MHCLIILLLLSLTCQLAFAKEIFPQKPDIEQRIQAMQDSGIDVSLYAVSDAAPSAPLSINGTRLSPPASVQKLLTTGAALMALGPDFRFETRLFASGDVDQGTLKAALILVGDGDPSLTGRWENGNALAVFERWATQFSRRGIKSVTGDIIADDDSFEDQPFAPGWEDYTPTDWYTAEVSALSFNDNCVDVRIRPPSSLGQVPRCSILPVSDYVSVDGSALKSRSRRSGWRVEVERKSGTNDCRLTGWVPAGGSPRTEYITVENASLFTVEVLRDVFEKQGIHIGGKPHDIDSPGLEIWKRKNGRIPAGWVLMATHASPPLSEILIPVNQRSQNLYAELLFKRIGVERGGEGSFTQGAKSVLRIWQQAGLDTSGIKMVDGSGLSRMNRLSPEAVVNALRILQQRPDHDVFIRSLAVAGHEGTLHSRFTTGVLEGNMRGKTGYVGGTRTLAGIAKDDGGNTVTFAVFIQGDEAAVKASTTKMDDLVQLLFR